MEFINGYQRVIEVRWLQLVECEAQGGMGTHKNPFCPIRHEALKCRNLARFNACYAQIVVRRDFPVGKKAVFR